MCASWQRAAGDLLQVGDRVDFSIDEDDGDLDGVISSVERDDEGRPAAAVVKRDDGTWATVDLRGLVVVVH